MRFSIQKHVITNNPSFRPAHFFLPRFKPDANRRPFC